MRRTFYYWFIFLTILVSAFFVVDFLVIKSTLKDQHSFISDSTLLILQKENEILKALKKNPSKNNVVLNGPPEYDLLKFFKNYCPFPVNVYSNYNPSYNGMQYGTFKTVLAPSQTFHQGVTKCDRLTSGRTYLYPFPVENFDTSFPVVDDVSALCDAMYAYSKDPTTGDAQFAPFSAGGSNQNPDQRGQNIEDNVYGSITSNPGYAPDISNVDMYIMPVKISVTYLSTTPKNDPTCTERYNNVSVTKELCTSDVGIWQDYTSVYNNGPAGFCMSPNLVCQNPPQYGAQTLCSKYDDILQPLIDKLSTLQVSVDNGVTFKSAWVKTPFPAPVPPALPTTFQSPTTMIYLCSGFLNYDPLSGVQNVLLNDNVQTPHLYLTDMCGAINRGACPLPTTTDLATTSAFALWVQSCASKKDTPPESWFTNSFYNPYSKWVHVTMKSRAYGFSQDEGSTGVGYMACQAGSNQDRPFALLYELCPTIQ